MFTVEKQGVISPRATHKPAHRIKDVLPRRNLTGTLCVISKHHNIAFFVSALALFEVIMDIVLKL
jgi:hypothetical protein